jgi:hypothetical protein
LLRYDLPSLLAAGQPETSKAESVFGQVGARS